MHLKLDFILSTERAQEKSERVAKKESEQVEAMERHETVAAAAAVVDVKEPRESVAMTMAKVMSVNLIREKGKMDEETKPRCRQPDGLDCDCNKRWKTTISNLKNEHQHADKEYK